jgi:hypothetical protein
MKRHATIMWTVLIVGVLIQITGCATPYNKAAFMSTDFHPAQIDTLTVMPVLDLRINKEKEFDLDKIVHKVVETELKKRHYKYAIVKNRALIANIDQDSLESRDNKWISNIDSNGGRWILIIALLDSYSKLTFGATANAEISGYIYDKNNSELIWQQKAIGSIGMGGLIGMSMKGLMEHDAILQAAQNLMTSIPVK